jgi:GNAT superfamily N-acetyltransferase
VIVEPFDVGSAAESDLLAWCAVQEHVRLLSYPDGFLPPVVHTLNRYRNRSPMRRNLVWVARDDSGIAAAMEADWWEAPDNRDRVWLFVDVPSPSPVVGALAAAAAEALRPLGRTTMMVDVPEGSPFSPWLAARGGKLGSIEQHNVLALERLSRDDIARDASAVAEGYEVVWFAGPVPDDLLEAYATLALTMNTAPRDDLTMDDWTYTPERIRDWEAGLAARGHVPYTAVARHVATDELVAFTQLIVAPDWPEVVEQDDTAVAVPHRGHGLGLLVKATNLLRLLDERPEARRVVTWNAASNEHMVAVNRRLGFVCEHVWENWEVPLDGLVSETQPA